MAVQRGEYTPTRSVEHTHEGSIGNLCNDKIAEKMNKVLVKFGF
jgi:argininosuccinate lyase